MESVDWYRLNQQIDRQLGQAEAREGQPCSYLGFLEVDGRLLHRLSVALEHSNGPTQLKRSLLSQLLVVIISGGTRSYLHRSDGQAPVVPGVQEPRGLGIPFQSHHDKIRQGQSPLL